MRPRPFRPGFDHTVEAPPTVVSRSVEQHMSGPAPFVGKSLSDHLMLTVPPESRHFWSPFLHLHVVAHRSEEGRPEPARSYVRGFYTPHPSLWSAFVMAYLASGVLIFFSAIWGLTQLQLGRSPLAFWLCGGFAAVAGALWLVARAGQRMAVEQMDLLHESVERALAEVGRVSPGAGAPS
ncbi:hypothetical protein [Engelhardtia mirabilis]|uniref:Uncharacterized protein n=1 Tax=Engelhardtia mirabilis TaxID=2528011 RepID=A0A518BHC6_9BACT|nr:hypothetical protein Pla133_14350 [Planctomycetes bacterium Pla133]QDV00691.1 hypothetical protein Pla86_14340 [Planctomycetes bacterium Pla86]